MHEELRLDNQICFRLYTAARLITQAYTPMLNELGITYPQYLVLMVPRSDGAVGAGFPTCERHCPSAVARNEHRYAPASAYGEAWCRGSQAWQGGQATADSQPHRERPCYGGRSL